MKSNDMENDYLKIENCIQGGLYEIDARNFSLGVYNKKEQSFIGIRYKFGSEFLDVEFHWDTGVPHGTVKPLRHIEECPYEARDTNNPELFDWLKERSKNL